MEPSAAAVVGGSAAGAVGLGAAGAATGVSEAENEPTTDMLWSLFAEPRRKRGLRPSQRRIRDRAFMDSQQMVREWEQIESQVKIRHGGGNRHNSDGKHSSDGDRYNNSDNRQNGTGYRSNNSSGHNNRPTTHQHNRRNNLLTVSQQMQLELISTEKRLRDTAVSLEEKQTVKALRRALNTVRVVAKGLAQKQWQMRSQMHRGLRVRGLSNSGAVLRQWWRKGEQHTITVSQQCAATITDWTYNATLHGAVQHWSLWRAARVHKAVQYRVRSGSDPEAIRYSLPLHVDFLWQRLRHPNNQYHAIKTTAGAVLAWQLNATDMIQQHVQRRQAFSCLSHGQRIDPAIRDTYSCVDGCPFAETRQWRQSYNRYEPCQLIRYRLVEYMQPYKVYCGSVGRLAFDRRHKSMVMLSLFNQFVQAVTAPTADGHEQVGMPSKAATTATAIGEQAITTLSVMKRAMVQMHETHLSPPQLYNPSNCLYIG